MTNFDNRVPCPGDMYRGGALCYRDCGTIGMANCGIGACSSDASACANEIINMILKIGEGLFTAVTTIASFGTASAATTAAKTSVKAAVKSIGKAAMKTAFNSIKKALTGGFNDFIKKKAFNHLKETMKDLFVDKVKALAISTVCSKVWEGVTTKTVSTPELKDITDSVIDTVDVLGVKGIVSSCSDVKSDGGLSCGKGVVDALSNFDPTGILSIVSAFMQPTCDVPVSKPVFEIDKLLEETKGLQTTASQTSGSCQSYNLNTSTSALTSTCKDKNSKDVTSTFNLSDCIGNDDGNLGRGNNFHKSCSGCTLNNNTSQLACNCKDRRGREKNTSVDILSILKNTDGKLSC